MDCALFLNDLHKAVIRCRATNDLRRDAAVFYAPNEHYASIIIGGTSSWATLAEKNGASHIYVYAVNFLLQP